MSEEKDFFKKCFNVVAGMEAKNENEIIAKEVVLDEVENLQQESQQLKEKLLVQNEEIKKYKRVVDRLIKKCELEKGRYDYGVWLKLNDSWKTLSDFADNIQYNLHQVITYAYQCDIKNSINQLIETTKNDVVLKEDILDILKEVEK